MTPVFWVAVLCSFVNFLLAVFVFPESLTPEKRAARKERQLASASEAARNVLGKDAEGTGIAGALRRLVTLFPTSRLEDTRVTLTCLCGR